MKKKCSPPSETTLQHLTFGRLAHQLASPSAYALFGLLIGWSVLQPLDSTAVFQGDALGQNFGWIFLTLLVSLLGWLQPRFQRVGNRELAIICVLVLWMVLVTIRAGWYCNPRTGWNGFWHITALFCFYYSSRCLLHDAKVRGMTVLVLLAAGVVLTGISLHQVFVDIPEQRALYEQDPDKVLRQLELDAPAGSPQRMRYEARLYSPEPFATFALTNSLAVLLSGLVVLLAGAIGHFVRISGSQHGTNAHGSNSAKKLRRYVHQKASNATVKANQNPSHFWRLFPLLIIFCLIGIVLILTRSRAAFMAVLITVPGVLANEILVRGRSSAFEKFRFLKAAYIRWWLSGIIVIAFGFLTFLWWFDASLFTGAINSFSFRRDYWSATLAMIQDHWLWGIGLGNFQSYYPYYMLPTASETIADPHNWLLDLVVNCSLPFSLVLLLGFLYSFAFRPEKSSVDSLESPQMSSPNSDSADQWNERWLGLGAGIGSLVVTAILWLFGLNLSLVIICLIAAFSLAIPIWPVVKSMIDISPVAVRWAALAMSLCLLISGSWQSPGLIIPFLCLVACSIGMTGHERPTSGDKRVFSAGESMTLRSRQIRGTAIFGVVFTTLIGFVLHGWNPVLKSGLTGMSQQVSLSQQIDSVKLAHQLDPWDSSWDRFLAALATQYALQSADKETFTLRSEEAMAKIAAWTKREPVNFLTWQAAGNRALDLAAGAERFELPVNKFLSQAAHYSAKAVQQFPTSVQLRVQSAFCLLLAGDKLRAVAELEKATELDAITPHSDRKLATQVVWVPALAGIPKFSSVDGDQWSPAEPLVNWLRKQL